MKIALILLGFSAVALAQRTRLDRQQATTPVPILRQINTVNEDGSYTYGYESADGSYKIENKAKNGEVTGKYGFYDDVGQLREVEYGASKLGFNPTGTDIRAPQLPDHVNSLRGVDYNDGDDGKYDANRYERPYDHLNVGPAGGVPAAQGGRRTRPRGQKRLNLEQNQPQQYTQYQPQQQQYQQPQQQQYQQPQQQYQPQQQQYQQPQQQYQQPQQQYQQPQQQYQQPQQQYTQYQQPQQQYQPRNPVSLPGNVFHGHPARNIDINTGSYSVNY